MKVIRLIGSVAVLLICLMVPARSQDSGHVQWVEKSLSIMQTIKVGMTRMDLEKVFEEDGGISTRGQQTYVYRGCPYFKVDVRFEPDPEKPEKENDKIIRMTRPYLAPPVMD